MKNFAKILTHWILSLSLLLSCVPAGSAAPSLSRFTVTPASYEGDVFGANEPSDGRIMVCGPEHKCGYLDTDGNVVIDFVFSYAGSFVDGLAPASVPYGKLGYIDKSGTFAIEPGFDMANEFSCGLALVRKGDKTGFIDKTGKFTDIIQDPDITPVSSFHGGVCWVENREGKRAILDAKGTLLTDFDFVWTGEWSDGVCWASKDTGSDFNHIAMGLVDKTGRFLIAPGAYTDAGEFSEGVCWAKKTGTDGIFLIDQQGNEIATISDGLMPSRFSGGVCVNVGGDLISVMNSNGVTIWSSKKYFPIHYGGFSEGVMLVQNQQDGTFHIMRDTAFAGAEKEESITGYGYLPEESPSRAFELALLTSRPDALINGVRTQIDPDDARVCAFIENGRTLLPMRFIAENLPGYTVTWDYITDSALVQSDYLSILLKADVASADVLTYNPEVRFYNQTVKSLDQPPVNRYDRLFLPVRALCEMVGVHVFYDARGLVVLSNTRTALSYSDATAILEQLTE